MSRVRKVETMSVSTVKNENGNVSCETPEGTVVQITINQRSALDCLLDTFRFFQSLKKNGQKTTKPPLMSGSAAQIGFGASFLTLGLVFVMLAIITSIVQPNLTIFYSGLHYWVGIPFLVSGALNFVVCKFPKKFWMVFSFISIFVSFGVSIAGVILTSRDTDHYYWIVNERICENIREDYYYRVGSPTRNYYDYQLRDCTEAIQKYKTLVIGLLFMTLLLTIWGLLLAIFNLGFRLKSCCSTCQGEKADQEEEGLLKPDLSDDIIIA